MEKSALVLERLASILFIYVFFVMCGKAKVREKLAQH